MAAVYSLANIFYCQKQNRFATLTLYQTFAQVAHRADRKNKFCVWRNAAHINNRSMKRPDNFADRHSRFSEIRRGQLMAVINKIIFFFVNKYLRRS